MVIQLSRKYQISDHIKSKVTNNPNENEYNKFMSKAQNYMAWLYGHIIWFDFLSAKKDVEERICIIGKNHIVCNTLTNARPVCIEAHQICFL